MNDTTDINGSGNRRIRLIVVDDQVAMRQSIRRLLNQTDDMLVVGEAIDGVDALDKVHAIDADAVVLDISMPRKNGLEVLRELKQDYPELPIVMLSIHSANQYEDRAKELGASAFVNKEDAADMLLPAIRAACQS
jgi:DNA-binding NarL/FixJ family response regulator